jgi:hypothetical protein
LTFLKTLDFSIAFFCDICLKERSFLKKKNIYLKYYVDYIFYL